MLVKIKWMIPTSHFGWFKPIFYAENWILPQIFPGSSSIYFSTVRIWVICCGIPFLFENVCELASGSNFVNTCETIFSFSVPSPITGIIMPSVPGAHSLTIRVKEETWGDLECLVFSMKTVLKPNNSKPERKFHHGLKHFSPFYFPEYFCFY